jgi:protein-arginine kinase activator protein McsA
LAYLLQTVIAVLLLGQAAAAAPFSHKVHLQLKLQCASCHTSTAASTKVEDNNLPPAAVCVNCHKDSRPIKTPRASKVSKFSHQQHLKMGNVAPVIAAAIDSKEYLSPPGDMRRWLNSKNACEACHRGLSESDAVTDAAFPQMADCLVCHSKIEKIEPPFSCTACHAASFKLTPASHDAKWLDFHGSGKANLDRQSCAVCHGRKFTCRGCH